VVLEAEIVPSSLISYIAFPVEEKAEDLPPRAPILLVTSPKKKHPPLIMKKTNNPSIVKPTIFPALFFELDITLSSKFYFLKK
jgi:hypothetical protein